MYLLSSMNLRENWVLAVNLVGLKSILPLIQRIRSEMSWDPILANKAKKANKDLLEASGKFFYTLKKDTGSQFPTSTWQ